MLSNIQDGTKFFYPEPDPLGLDVTPYNKFVTVTQLE